jgi:hypothetical protein
MLQICTERRMLRWHYVENLPIGRDAAAKKKTESRRCCEAGFFGDRCEVSFLLMIHFELLAAACLLLSLHSSATAPPSLSECGLAHQSYLQLNDSPSIATLEVCATHYRSEETLRLVALAHARRPSASSAAKVQQLLALRPADSILLHAAAAIYRQSGHGLWAALAMSQSVFAYSSIGSLAVERRMEEAAAMWDDVQQSAHASAAAKCCDNQEPSSACSEHFSDAAKFIAM